MNGFSVPLRIDEYMRFETAQQGGRFGRHIGNHDPLRNLQTVEPRIELPNNYSSQKSASHLNLHAQKKPTGIEDLHPDH